MYDYTCIRCVQGIIQVLKVTFANYFLIIFLVRRIFNLFWGSINVRLLHQYFDCLRSTMSVCPAPNNDGSINEKL